jgi:hypothetical protein
MLFHSCPHPHTLKNGRDTREFFDWISDLQFCFGRWMFTCFFGPCGRESLSSSHSIIEFWYHVVKMGWIRQPNGFRAFQIKLSHYNWPQNITWHTLWESVTFNVHKDSIHSGSQHAARRRTDHSSTPADVEKVVWPTTWVWFRSDSPNIPLTSERWPQYILDISACTMDTKGHSGICPVKQCD